MNNTNKLKRIINYKNIIITKTNNRKNTKKINKNKIKE